MNAQSWPMTATFFDFAGIPIFSDGQRGVGKIFTCNLKDVFGIWPHSNGEYRIQIGPVVEGLTMLFQIDESEYIRLHSLFNPIPAPLFVGDDPLSQLAKAKDYLGSIYKYEYDQYVSTEDGEGSFDMEFWRPRMIDIGVDVEAIEKEIDAQYEESPDTDT